MAISTRASKKRKLKTTVEHREARKAYKVAMKNPVTKAKAKKANKLYYKKNKRVLLTKAKNTYKVRKGK